MAAFDIFRLLPTCSVTLRHGSKSQRSGQLPDDFPAYLLKAARRGLLEGGFMYVYEAIRDRRQSISVTEDLSGAADT